MTKLKAVAITIMTAVEAGRAWKAAAISAAIHPRIVKMVPTAQSFLIIAVGSAHLPTLRSTDGTPLGAQVLV